MKKMLFLMIILTFLNRTDAQNKIIKGNGNSSTRTHSIDAFTHLSIDLYCDVYVQLGAMQMATIEGDKNVINKIELKQSGSKLEISVKEGYWIQKSRPKIYLQTPFLTKLTTRGHQTNIGEVVIDGIDVNKFETDILYGDISLIGRVQELKLNSSNRNYYGNSGIVDASQLVADVVDAKVYGSNRAIVNPIVRLGANLKYDAVLQYVNEPQELKMSGDAEQIHEGTLGIRTQAITKKYTKNEVKKPSLKYVTVKVKNNSLTRRHFVIKGANESGRGFSYGFPMMPLAVREKKVPIGTKIFLQKKGLLNKKLVTITAEDDGKVLTLFDS